MAIYVQSLWLEHRYGTAANTGGSLSFFSFFDFLTPPSSFFSFLSFLSFLPVLSFFAFLSFSPFFTHFGNGRYDAGGPTRVGHQRGTSAGVSGAQTISPISAEKQQRPSDTTMADCLCTSRTHCEITDDFHWCRATVSCHVRNAHNQTQADTSTQLNTPHYQEHTNKHSQANITHAHTEPWSSYRHKSETIRFSNTWVANRPTKILKTNIVCTWFETMVSWVSWLSKNEINFVKTKFGHLTIYNNNNFYRNHSN